MTDLNIYYVCSLFEWQQGKSNEKSVRHTKHRQNLNMGKRSIHSKFDAEGNVVKIVKSKMLHKTKQFLAMVSQENVTLTQQSSMETPSIVNPRGEAFDQSNSASCDDSLDDSNSQMEESSHLDQSKSLLLKEAYDVKTSYHECVEGATIEESKSVLALNSSADSNDSEYKPPFQVPKRQKKKQKRKNKVKVLPMPTEIQEDRELRKYWAQRYRLFSKFDQGIIMDKGEFEVMQLERDVITCKMLTIALKTVMIMYEMLKDL